MRPWESFPVLAACGLSGALYYPAHETPSGAHELTRRPGGLPLSAPEDLHCTHLRTPTVLPWGLSLCAPEDSHCAPLRTLTLRPWGLSLCAPENSHCAPLRTLTVHPCGLSLCAPEPHIRRPLKTVHGYPPPPTPPKMALLLFPLLQKLVSGDINCSLLERIIRYDPLLSQIGFIK